MQSNDFDTGTRATRELSDEELTQIQGGNFLGDAWNAVKNAVKHVIDVITHPKPPKLPIELPSPLPRPPYPPLPFPWPPAR